MVIVAILRCKTHVATCAEVTLIFGGKILSSLSVLPLLGHISFFPFWGTESISEVEGPFLCQVRSDSLFPLRTPDYQGDIWRPLGFEEIIQEEKDFCLIL